MALLSSLTRDLTEQDGRKIATIVSTMTVGLPVYTALMSLTGVIDIPTTARFLAITSLIGFAMSLLMIFAYLLGNKVTA
ncbi:hypothetical protein EXE44_05395 [Halorubrum sp. SS7]|uniref:hypothetical protein n=1 Tax=Halorubrum sp. SS7 TaxID=2518119 RepID=UPI0010F45F4B|nr:hypothetical protein [Halorubrum sp. SS7]TKX52429.1 hypothetical protein EXE42_16290 [Halorubrum sp. SP3]TKX58981.1 hypothetical protein EXE44_05395 [Halorubrum sp. SS7]